MKILRSGLFLLAASPVWAGYQYYLTDTLKTIDATKWAVTGAVAPGAQGFEAPDAAGGSLISRVPIPDGTSEAEVAMTITLNASGGTYTELLQASAGARTGSASSGNYLAFEMQNPEFDPKGYCSANFLLFQGTGGVVSLVAAFQHSCRNGMTMRMAVQGGTVIVWPDQAQPMEYNLGLAGAGQPGIGSYGTPAGNSIPLVQLGAIDRKAPPAVDHTKVAVSAFRNRVDLQWQPVTADPNGSGLANYWIYRDGVYLGRTSATIFSDEAVAPGAKYVYSIYSVTQHHNLSPAATVTATVPSAPITPLTGSLPAPPKFPVGPAPKPMSVFRPELLAPAVTTGTPQADSGTGLEPRRVGVRALGSYWGDAGEQIDTDSGNLNLSIPLLRPQQRTGWSVTLSLSYNSQNWRRDSSGVWNLGQDVGYGYGWKFQIGSVTPVYGPGGQLDHYLFTDGSGAEYSLNVNHNGLWSSQEGVYVTYDPSTLKLDFNDGSYWWMGCQSAGGEQDAGTLYPANIQDSNGNYLSFVYLPGSGSGNLYTSARIGYIYDPRSTSGPSYIFAYNGDAIPHMTVIQGVVSPAESYNFTYLENQSLNDPFTGAYFGTAGLLQSITPWNLPASYSFGYQGAAELTQYTTPYGGSLQWSYRTFTYGIGITLREILNRWMTPYPGAAMQAYGIGRRDDIDSTSSNPFHILAGIADLGAGTQKIWWHNYGPGGQVIVPIQYEEQNPNNVANMDKVYWWTQDANGVVYMNKVVTTLSPNTSSAISQSTLQTLDTYGNVVERQVYDWG